MKDLFSFTKKELNGLFIFCLILLIIIFYPAVHSFFFSPEVYDHTRFKEEIARIYFYREKKEHRISYGRFKGIRGDKKISYFLFDPNALSEAAWMNLGLSEKKVRVIKNYLSRGGRFYRKEDLRKIYSISETDYARLEPYIRIPEVVRGHAVRYTPGKSRESRVFEKLPAVELNAADSAGLERLRGIGPAFALRILKYRDRLGGFYKKEQLLEVYGLDSARFAGFEQQLMLDKGLIKKININTAAFEELKRHPYLSYKQINAILQYRKQHGKYNSQDDLTRIAILNDEILRKIGPYLDY